VHISAGARGMDIELAVSDLVGYGRKVRKTAR
jgi:prolyl-tRNA editing enzyme YbaK/EbsC (Cys-tRNA(Pro) deacylase)